MGPMTVNPNRAEAHCDRAGFRCPVLDLDAPKLAPTISDYIEVLVLAQWSEERETTFAKIGLREQHPKVSLVLRVMLSHSWSFAETS